IAPHRRPRPPCLLPPVARRGRLAAHASRPRRSTPAALRGIPALWSQRPQGDSIRTLAGTGRQGVREGPRRGAIPRPPGFAHALSRGNLDRLVLERRRRHLHAAGALEPDRPRGGYTKGPRVP